MGNDNGDAKILFKTHLLQAYQPFFKIYEIFAFLTVWQNIKAQCDCFIKVLQHNVD
jgi:hypothetical protein